MKALEATLGDVDVGYEGVELVHGVLVLVPQPRQADAHAEGDTSHTLDKRLVTVAVLLLKTNLGPDGLVEPGVDPHILGAHLLLGELLDLLDSWG